MSLWFQVLYGDLISDLHTTTSVLNPFLVDLLGTLVFISGSTVVFQLVMCTLPSCSGLFQALR